MRNNNNQVVALNDYTELDGGEVFTPLAISGLGVWLDASNTASVSVSDGAVSEWADLSGNNRHFAQSSSSARPLYVENALNGLPVVRADGTNHWLLNSGSGLNANACTIFAVTRQLQWITDTSKPANLFHTDLPVSGFTTLGIRVEQYNNGEDARIGDNDSAQPLNFGAAATQVKTLNVPRLMSYEFDSTTRFFRAQRNALLVTGVTVDSANNPTSFGERFALFSGFQDTSVRRANAEIAEFLVYTRVLTATERELVEGYLAWKWGLREELPSAHSYAYAFSEYSPVNKPTNSDALNWESSVYEYGGSVSVKTLNAVSTFCNSIDAAGIRDRFYRLNLFCGSNLTAALIPVYRSPNPASPVWFGYSTDFNVSFVEADYAENGAVGFPAGLKGNGSSKQLLPGFAPRIFYNALTADFSTDLIALDEFSFSAYVTQAETGTQGTLISRYNSFDVGSESRSLELRAFPTEFLFTSANVTTLAWNKTTGHVLGTYRVGGQTLYGDGVQVGDTERTVSALDYSLRFRLFIRAQVNNNVDGLDGTGGVISAARIAGYHIGRNFTAAQATAFYSALQTFQTALARNV